MQRYMKLLLMLTVTAIALMTMISLREGKLESERSADSSSQYFGRGRDGGQFPNSETGQPDRYQRRKHKPAATAAVRSAATHGLATTTDRYRRFKQPPAVSMAVPTAATTHRPVRPATARVVETEQRQPEMTATQPPEPIKGTYPKWFSTAWSRSRAREDPQTPVRDQPLFSACEAKRRARTSGDRTRFIEPKPYLPESKNPCWYEDPDRRTRFKCIPYFYIAGVAKCGTTDLYRRLRLHPEIMKGTQKEYHFWDRERFGNVEISEDGQVLDVKRDPWTFDDYTERITGTELRLVEKEIKTEGASIKIFGDGSPSYLWDILNWQLLEGNQNCNEPRIVIGQHIQHINPKSKMILIFRHPTPRLYSRFLSRIWRTPFLKHADSTTFHNYVKRGVQMYRECFKRWSIRACAYNFTLYDDAVVRLVEGMYPIFMADWLRIWPRDQMLILRSEDYGTNMSETLEQAFNFLGVGQLTGENYEQVMNWRLVNVGNQYDKIGLMKNETIKILDQFYQPFVEQFAELLQDRRFLWRDTYTPNLEER